MDIMSLLLTRLTSPKEALSKLKARAAACCRRRVPPQGVVGSLVLRRAKNEHRKVLHALRADSCSTTEFLPHGYAKLKLPETSLLQVREHLLQTFPGMPHKQLIVQGADTSKFQQLLPPNATRAFLGYDRGAAVVITVQELVARQDAGPPPDCGCENPVTPHEYRAGIKRTGDVCDNCAYVVDC